MSDTTHGDSNGEGTSLAVRAVRSGRGVDTSISSARHRRTAGRRALAVATVIWATVCVTTTVDWSAAGAADGDTTTTQPTNTQVTDTSDSVQPTDSTDGSTTTASSTTAPAVADQQSVVVTDVAVAVADSGDNTQSTDTTVAPSVGATATAVSTGDASAVGNQDTTAIDQRATVVLADDAAADVLQLALVLNIGLANASTGDLTATSGSGVGAVATGNASAIGLDGATLVVQAGDVSATTASETAGQSAITIRVGLSLANTGANVTSGPSTGGLSTGNAAALGNQSSTGVTQNASVSAGGASAVSVDQRVLVLNLGVAFAGTGGTTIALPADVSAAASALLASPDTANAQALVDLLMPGLLRSVAVAGPAAGGTTGDATAIGNRSSTVVDQSATATATGTATAALGQQVVVANVGMGVASTGGNGSATTDALLVSDPSTMAAVQSIATFLSGILTDLRGWDGRGPLADRDLTLQFGGTTLVIGGDLAGSLVQSTSPSGAARTIRQLSAIISLGMALGSSGGNTTVLLDDATGGPAAGAITLRTGDATAANVSVVAICQRHDRPAARCNPAEQAVGGVASEVPVLVAGERLLAAQDGRLGGALPTTGASHALVLLSWAVLALLAGSLLLQCSRRPDADERVGDPARRGPSR